MQEQEFTTADAALAKIPEGREFRVQRFSGGRPQEVCIPGTDEKVWDAIRFDSALRAGLIETKCKYHLIPIISGKTTRQKITLNLSMENSSQTTQVVGLPGQPIQTDSTDDEGPAPRMMAASSGSPHLQEVVVDCLNLRMTEDRQDIKDKEARILELLNEVQELKLKVLRLELEKEHAERLAEHGDSGNKFLGEIMSSPALPIFLQMVGAPKQLQEAAKSHQAT